MSEVEFNTAPASLNNGRPHRILHGEGHFTPYAHPRRSGKKVGRRKDLLNIEVSGLGRIRQRNLGVGFSLLV